MLQIQDFKVGDCIVFQSNFSIIVDKLDCGDVIIQQSDGSFTLVSGNYMTKKISQQDFLSFEHNGKKYVRIVEYGCVKLKKPI